MKRLSTTVSAPADRRYLTEAELASRWGLCPKTLQRWRSSGVGPVYAKFSRSIKYPLDGKGGVLDYEQSVLRSPGQPTCSRGER